MNSNPATLRIDLLENFQHLLSSLNQFCTALRNDNRLPAWVSRTEQEINASLAPRTKAISLYQALWYEGDQDGRETLTCPGIIGASPATLEAARTCNTKKDKFKAIVLQLKILSKAEASLIMADLHSRNEEVATAMKRMGAARLNLKQAYRHIPLLDRRPLKIGFTWSKQGRTIQRTNVSETRRLLERRRETPQIRQELNQLSTLPDNEQLARVRGVCPHLRANIVFAEGGKASNRRRLIQAPLPILVPLQGNEALPDFVPIETEPQDNPRLRRSDVRIEDDVFLPSIRVYRYREPYR
ncbi:MAG: DNA replication terminus site-binding protein [Candidatus Competibacteraceae bacterium]|jgi:hypothetical protein|nr:DNA replication terminus site-binding protein [Candidatus Competibacteraceae bacterium]